MTTHQQPSWVPEGTYDILAEIRDEQARIRAVYAEHGIRIGSFRGGDVTLDVYDLERIAALFDPFMAQYVAEKHGWRPPQIT